MAGFDDNQFIFENWKQSCCKESIPWKNDPWFIRIASFFKNLARSDKEKFPGRNKIYWQNYLFVLQIFFRKITEIGIFEKECWYIFHDFFIFVYKSHDQAVY